MAFVYALDPAEPANTDLVQDGAAEIRLTKNALIERLQSFFQNVDNDPLQVKSGVTFLGNFTQSAGTAALQAVTGTTAVFSSTIQGTTITATVGFSGILTGSLVGNASTATSLLNTRTIWGQNFNGSANVSGAMTGVTSIVMAGALSGVTTLAMGGALSGVTTIATSSTINSQTISATANFTGTATFASTVTVTTGGLTVSAGTTAVQAFTATTATLSAALTYGGVTLSNAVTGTGNMVLSASPTFTGTLTTAAISATTIANSGDISTTINTAATTRWTMNNTAGAGQIGLKFVRGGGTATDWEFYVPSGSADIRLYNLGDKFTFSSTGVFTATNGLTVSAGTTAVQALTATTGVFSDSVSITKANTPLLINNTLAAGNYRAIIQAQRGTTDRYYIGFDSSDQFVLTNAAANAANLTVTDAGALTVRAGITATTGTFSSTISGTTITASGDFHASGSSSKVYFNSQTANYFQYILVAGTHHGIAWLAGDDRMIVAYNEGGTGKLSFFNAGGSAQPTVSGSKAANAALASLMTALSGMGLVIDSTS